MIYNDLNVTTRRALLAFVSALGLLATSSAVKAGPIVSYQLTVSPDMFFASDPHNSYYQQIVSWMQPSALAPARNTPAMILKNTSSSQVNLTSFQIDISAKPAYVFDQITIVQAPPGFDPIFTTLADIDQGGDKNPIFAMSFANSPLAPGQSIWFYAEIDSAPGQPARVHDFRSVFWDMFGGFSGDNALIRVQAKSSDPQYAQVASVQANLFEFRPFTMPYSDPVAGTFGESVVVSARFGEQVGAYVFNQEAPLEVEVIPEPTGATLILCAVAGLASYCCRRRRRHNTA